MAANSNRLISEQELEAALDWLRDNAAEIGKAKANTVRCAHMLKVVKALEMKRVNQLPVSQQEREAYTSEKFMEALEADAVAAGEYEKMKALREAAALKIEAWRSEQANYRAMKI